MTAKFHRDVSWPPQLQALLPRRKMMTRYSEHATRAANTDKYGVIKLPVYFDLTQAYIFEVEIDGPYMKIVFRYPHNEIYDMVVAAIVEPGHYLFIKTVWLNAKTDTHKTLDTSQYDRV